MQISFSGSIAAITILALSAAAAYRIEHRPAPIAPVINLDSLPRTIGPWRGEPTDELDIAARETLKLNSYLRRIYRDGQGRAVFVYLGYWEKQTGDYQAAKHSPALCLPANGWNVLELKRSTVSGQPVNYLIAAERNRKNLYYYWFFSGNESYTEEWTTLLRISFGLITHGRSDGGIVELSVPLEEEGLGKLQPQMAEQTANDFMTVLLPELRKITG